MGGPRAHKLLLLLVAVAVVMAGGMGAHAQKPSSSSSPPTSTGGGGRSNSKSAQAYSCFFGECSISKATKQRDGGAGLASCLRTAFPSNTNKTVILPGSPAFDYARRMVSSQFNREPAAVVYAQQTSDVQAAVKCAYKNSVRVSVAGGRHSYGGWSVVTDFLIVDTSNMTKVEVVGRQGKADIVVHVGPGNTNALLISQLYKAGFTTAGTIIGQCPSVGVSGFTLGGGQGELSRMFGLACDQVVSLQLVDYKGDLVTADAKQNSGLFWASCGGGGGLGVVTRWTVKAHDLGSEPFSKITVAWNPESAIAAMLRFQEFIMSEKTDLRFTGGGAGLGGFELNFAGPISAAMPLLKAAGLLNPAWLNKAVPSQVYHNRAHLNLTRLPVHLATIPDMPPVGVIATRFINYYESVMYVECQWFADDRPYPSDYVLNAAKFGFGPTESCNDIDTLNQYKALAAQRGSFVNTGITDMWRQYSMTNACRQLPPLSKAAWEALNAVTNDPRCAWAGDVQDLSKRLQDDKGGEAYYCLALKRMVGKPNWNHLLGGAVAAVPSNATAWPWRKTISPLCFDSAIPAFLNGFEADGTPKQTVQLPMDGESSVSVSPAALIKAVKQVQSAYLDALYRVLGKDTARQAYFNYQSDQVEDYEAANWGPNYKRLQQIKAKWDPDGVFSKPFTVRPATA